MLIVCTGCRQFQYHLQQDMSFFGLALTGAFTGRVRCIILDHALAYVQVDYQSVPAQPTKAVPRSGFLQHLIHWMLLPEPRKRPTIDQVLRETKTVLQACESGGGAARV